MTPARCRKVKGIRDERRTEAPVNGGSNYNCPKVTAIAALVKSGYMLEYPRISQYSGTNWSDNLWSADNQQERPLVHTSGILRDYTPDTRDIE